MADVSKFESSKEIEEYIITYEPPARTTAALMAELDISFPDGTAPVPQPIMPLPTNNAPLPEADVVIVTWTLAEANALADTLTPKVGRQKWYPYRRRFDEDYRKLIRDGAPAFNAGGRLGYYYMTKIGKHKVLCYKSELHMNQDGKPDGLANSPTGGTTLPVKKMFEQIIAETKARLVITEGTAGGVYLEQSLGDVSVTRGAKFRCSSEFKNAPFNEKTYTSNWKVPTKYIAQAEKFMDGFKKNVEEPAFAPPTKRNDYKGTPVKAWPNEPRIWLDGVQPTKHGRPIMKDFHPMLTTDFFEFGTSANKLEEQGCGVEMGDAVLGLVCQEMGNKAPQWLVIRNMSDPQINADLPTQPRKLNMQTHWAVWYYEQYGYWTSVNSALACWAVVAAYDG